MAGYNLAAPTFQSVADVYQKVYGARPDDETLVYWWERINGDNGQTWNGDLSLADLEQTLVTQATEDNGLVQDPSSGFYVSPEGLTDPSSNVNNSATQFFTNDSDVITTSPGTSPATSTQTSGVLDLFQPDVYPISNSNSVTEASNTSTNSSENQSTNQATAQSTGQSNSESGLAESFTDPLLTGLLPTLQDSINDLPGQVDEWTDKNLAASRSASKNLLDGHLTNVLADMSKRGMVNSSVAGDAVSQAAVDVGAAQTATDLGIMSQGNEMRLEVPSILSGVAQLGNRTVSQSDNSSQSASTGQSTGSSVGQSTGSSSGVSSASSSDPLAPYELYANMLTGLM